MTTYKGNAQTRVAKAEAKAKREASKLKVCEDLLDAQKRQTSELLEKARNVGLSAARLVHQHPDDDNNIVLFRRILANRISKSHQVGPVYAIVAERSYWAELKRLENGVSALDT